MYVCDYDDAKIMMMMMTLILMLILVAMPEGILMIGVTLLIVQ